jgi:hypothetical protein
MECQFVSVYRPSFHTENERVRHTPPLRVGFLNPPYRVEFIARATCEDFNGGWGLPPAD